MAVRRRGTRLEILGASEVKRKLGDWEREVDRALFRTAQYFAPQAQDRAQETAPWQDHTGHARQGLRATARRLPRRTGSEIRLAHGVFYGYFLETGYRDGRHHRDYSVILHTLNHFRNPIRDFIGQLRLQP